MTGASQAADFAFSNPPPLSRARQTPSSGESDQERRREIQLIVDHSEETSDIVRHEIDRAWGEQ